jgi:hypothetical protein
VLIQRIQKDLFDFIGSDPDEMEGLIEFWYSANSAALSAALSQSSGLNLIVNVSSFKSFEELSKKLYLVADTLILRDTRTLGTEEQSFRFLPIPQDYKPSYLDELGETLKSIRPSPLTLSYRPPLYWTSDSKQLKNGYLVAYAGGGYNSIPREFVEWISGRGRSYLETGRMVYAPFIPPLSMELEFLKNDVFLPAYFNATPCFHQTYDWLTGDALSALLSLQFPFLDGLNIETISRVKEDHRDQFERFSRTLLNAVQGVKNSFGTERFIREVRYIQANQVDAGLNDISKTVSKIAASASLRKQGILIGLLGLNAAVLTGASPAAMATAAAGSIGAFVLDRIARMKEDGELKEQAPYFLWKLQQTAHRE